MYSPTVAMHATEIPISHARLNTMDPFSGQSTAGSILQQSLPASLSAPSGWVSELVESSLSIPDATETNLVEHDQAHLRTNMADAAPTFFSSNGQTVNERTFVNLDAHNSTSTSSHFTTEQRTSIENIESEQPPPLVVRKTLPNNLVTYKQNISVKYLQPPTPPPPGPIIIRKRVCPFDPISHTSILLSGEIRPPPPPPQSPVQVGWLIEFDGALGLLSRRRSDNVLLRLERHHR